MYIDLNDFICQLYFTITKQTIHIYINKIRLIHQTYNYIIHIIGNISQYINFPINIILDNIKFLKIIQFYMQHKYSTMEQQSLVQFPSLLQQPQQKTSRINNQNKIASYYGHSLNCPALLNGYNIQNNFNNGNNVNNVNNGNKGQFIISYNFDRNQNVYGVTHNIFIGWDDSPYVKPNKKVMSRNNNKNKAQQSKILIRNRLLMMNKQNISKQDKQKNKQKQKEDIQKQNQLTKRKNININNQCNNGEDKKMDVSGNKQNSILNRHQIYQQSTLKHDNLIAKSNRVKDYGLELRQNKNNSVGKHYNNTIKTILNPIQQTYRNFQNQKQTQIYLQLLGLKDNKAKQYSFSCNKDNKGLSKNVINSEHKQQYRNGGNIQYSTDTKKYPNKQKSTSNFVIKQLNNQREINEADSINKKDKKQKVENIFNSTEQLAWRKDKLQKDLQHKNIEQNTGQIYDHGADSIKLIQDLEKMESQNNEKDKDQTKNYFSNNNQINQNNHSKQSNVIKFKQDSKILLANLQQKFQNQYNELQNNNKVYQFAIKNKKNVHSNKMVELNKNEKKIQKIKYEITKNKQNSQFQNIKQVNNNVEQKLGDKQHNRQNYLRIEEHKIKNENEKLSNNAQQKINNFMHKKAQNKNFSYLKQQKTIGQPFQKNQIKTLKKMNKNKVQGTKNVDKKQQMGHKNINYRKSQQNNEKIKSIDKSQRIPQNKNKFSKNKQQTKSNNKILKQKITHKNQNIQNDKVLEDQKIIFQNQKMQKVDDFQQSNKSKQQQHKLKQQINKNMINENKNIQYHKRYKKQQPNTQTKQYFRQIQDKQQQKKINNIDGQLINNQLKQKKIQNRSSIKQQVKQRVKNKQLVIKNNEINMKINSTQSKQKSKYNQQKTETQNLKEIKKFHNTILNILDQEIRCQKPTIPLLKQTQNDKNAQNIIQRQYKQEIKIEQKSLVVRPNLKVNQQMISDKQNNNNNNKFQNIQSKQLTVSFKQDQNNPKFLQNKQQPNIKQPQLDNIVEKHEQKSQQIESKQKQVKKYVITQIKNQNKQIQQLQIKNQKTNININSDKSSRQSHKSFQSKYSKNINKQNRSKETKQINSKIQYKSKLNYKKQDSANNQSQRGCNKNQQIKQQQKQHKQLQQKTNTQVQLKKSNNGAIFCTKQDKQKNESKRESFNSRQKINQQSKVKVQKQQANIRKSQYSAQILTSGLKNNQNITNKQKFGAYFKNQQQELYSQTTSKNTPQQKHRFFKQKSIYSKTDANKNENHTKNKSQHIEKSQQSLNSQKSKISFQQVQPIQQQIYNNSQQKKSESITKPIKKLQENNKKEIKKTDTNIHHPNINIKPGSAPLNRISAIQFKKQQRKEKEKNNLQNEYSKQYNQTKSKRLQQQNKVQQPNIRTSFVDTDSELQVSPYIQNSQAPKQLTCISKKSSNLILQNPYNIGSNNSIIHTFTSRNSNRSQPKQKKIKQMRNVSIQMQNINKQNQIKQIKKEGVNASVGTSKNKIQIQNIKQMLKDQKLNKQEKGNQIFNQDANDLVSFGNLTYSPQIQTYNKQSFLDISQLDKLNKTQFLQSPSMLQRRFNNKLYQHAPIIQKIYGDQKIIVQAYLSQISFTQQQIPFNLPISKIQYQQHQKQDTLSKALQLILQIDSFLLHRIVEPYVNQKGCQFVWLYCHGIWKLFSSNIKLLSFGFMIRTVLEKAIKQQYDLQNAQRLGIQQIIRMITGIRVMQLKNKKKLSQQLEYHLKKGNIIKGICTNPQKPTYSILSVQTTPKLQKLIQIRCHSTIQLLLNQKSNDEIIWIKQQVFQKYFDYFLLICYKQQTYWTSKQIKNNNTVFNQTLVYTMDSIVSTIGSIQLHTDCQIVCKMDLYRQVKPKLLKFIGSVNQKHKTGRTLLNPNPTIYFNFCLKGRYYLLIKFTQIPKNNPSTYRYISIDSTQKIQFSYLQSIQHETYKNNTSQYIQINNNIKSNRTNKSLYKQKSSIKNNQINQKMKDVRKMFIDYLISGEKQEKKQNVNIQQ